ncbi:RICIN domain-containing protein [Catellatospora sp. KI3]|uniref:RICIN domain-containing protein n=1 Tax=Catellatospora sp. KI3 TaxID=3041620 RepID=UPI0024823EE9|nr:RICIN domain-containing protein [Catellatospora sp. KI3]MDI1465156.1 RICIN domain-containing protein [Catellatospora sp. KI3]
MYDHHTRRRGRRPVTLLAATALLSAAALASAAPTASAAATGPTVSAWVTTPDRAQLLNPVAAQVFNSEGPRPGQLITVDPAQTLQTMDGFGASITDSSAALLYRLPAAQRDQVMVSLFDPSAGIGLSMLRQPIGSSDFADEPHFTYDDLPTGQTDYQMTRFSIAHDEAQVLPLLRRARQLNPSLKIVATPWGQPAWMKANNSMIGGQLRNDPAVFRAYALYLVKFVQAYQAAGVPIYALTVQNEPQNRTPDGYPGTDLPVAHQAAVINELGPQLAAAGLGHVKIISYDHNWAEHPDDIADAARLGVPAEPNYPYDILRTSAAQWIAGTAYHCYSGDAGAQTALHNAFPAKDIWFTECSGWHGVNDPAAQVFSDTLKWHARNLEVGVVRNWAKSVVNWNLALDPRGGPVNGGCGNNPAGMCSGVVTVDGTTVTRNAEYYTLGHLARFVKTGAVRIGSNNAGDLENVAFRNPDGSYALFVANVGGGTQTFGVQFNGMTVAYTVAPGAITTLTWPAGGTVDTQAPSVPGGLSAGGTTSTSTTLNWAASTDNVGVTGYLVFRNGVQVGTPTGTSFTDTGLSAATSYAYTVKARDAAGNQSAAAAALTVTTSSGGGGGGGGIDPNAWYQVINTNSGKCLDDADWSTGNGASLQQWTCSAPAAANQLWQLRPTSGGYYQVVNRNAATLVWDVDGGTGATGDGTQVHLWSYVGGTNQQWQPVALGGGLYRFVARHSGKCLDVRDVSTANGARLQQWTCTGGPAQSFRLTVQP